MEQKTITIKKLYILLKERLEMVSFLVGFYIGKTDDIEKRGKEHKEKDGLPKTVQIAYGDARTISEGEKYLIKKFKEDDKYCQNINIGGGNPNADKLYISYACDLTKAKTIHELDDDDLVFPAIYLLIKQTI